MYQPVVNALTPKLRVDYRRSGAGAAGFLLEASPIVTTAWAPLAQSQLTPRYGLISRTVSLDNTAPSRETTTAYGDLAVGLATSSTSDPAGLALVSSSTLESAFRRQLTRTMPAGGVYTYSYYGLGAEAMSSANPCVAGSPAVNQGGRQASRTSPDPDAGGVQTARVERWVCDTWTCTTFDARWRPTQTVYPAFGIGTARTVTYDYAVGGNPLVTAVCDNAVAGSPTQAASGSCSAKNGVITMTVDLNGRVVSYSDVWAQTTTTTTTYDEAGRVATQTGPAGLMQLAYAGGDPRPVTQTLDGVVLAEVNYSVDSTISNIKINRGVNGSAWGESTLDNFGRQNTVAWKANLISPPFSQDEYTYSRAGKVTEQKIDGVDPYTAGQNYTYDAVGRLTAARLPGQAYAYSYASTGGCGLNTTAGKNGNRTAFTSTPTVGPVVSASYCYDHADRLTSTTAAGYTGSIVYDGHGSATTIAGETHGYDVLDRHLTTGKGALTVTYVRDGSNRIVSRSNGSTTVRYAFSGPSDSPVATLTTANVVSEKFVGVLGGVSLTKRAAGNIWSFANLHGDVVRTIDDTAGGVVSAAMLYEPFGMPIGSLTPDNAAGNFDFGWLGSKYRPSEGEATLASMIEMGERQYSAALGRFIEVDPVEGGNPNDYIYPNNPVTEFDLDGRAGGACVGCLEQNKAQNSCRGKSDVPVCLRAKIKYDKWNAKPFVTRWPGMDALCRYNILASVTVGSASAAGKGATYGPIRDIVHNLGASWNSAQKIGSKAVGFASNAVWLVDASCLTRSIVRPIADRP
jgi:RHS repeat-associated protein